MKEIAALHRFIKFLIKKHRNNHVSPEEIDDALNWGSLDKFNELYGLPEKYVMPYRVPMVGHEGTQKNKDDLRVFIKKPVNLPIVDGLASLPLNYVHVSYLQTTNDGITKEVEFISDDNWSFRINRITAAPSYSNPVCRQYDDKLEVRPTDIQSVFLSYLALPTKCKWAYTLGVNGRPIYNDNASVDFEWRQENHIDIIARALKFMGVNLEDETLLGYSDSRIQSGT